MTSLPSLDPLVCIIAAERTRTRPDLFDDACQEGRIAVWQAETKRPDAPRAYLTAAARNGVANHLRGRGCFGAPSRQGRAEPLDHADSIHVDEDTEETLALLEDPEASLALDRAEIALARAEVRSAVAAIEDPTDREIVYRRFWLDETWPEVAVAMGRKTEAIRRRFVDHLAPALVERLDHLRSVAR